MGERGRERRLDGREVGERFVWGVGCVWWRDLTSVDPRVEPRRAERAREGKRDSSHARTLLFPPSLAEQPPRAARTPSHLLPPQPRVSPSPPSPPPSLAGVLPSRPPWVIIDVSAAAAAATTTIAVILEGDYFLSREVEAGGETRKAGRRGGRAEDKKGKGCNGEAAFALTRD